MLLLINKLGWKISIKEHKMDQIDQGVGGGMG